MKLRAIIIAQILLLLSINAISQEQYFSNKLWLRVDKKLIGKTGEEILKQNASLQKTLKQHNVYQFRKAFPYSGVELLKSIYKLKFTGSFEKIQKEINSKHGQIVHDIIKMHKTEKVQVYEPSDYMWDYPSEDDSWLWHLQNINASKAWNITKSNSNIKVGVLDTWFDPSHPDLDNQLLYDYDPYDGKYFTSYNCCNSNHGTKVASFVAAETDGGGQLASVGFNTKLIGYQAWDGDYLERAQHAALNKDVDVLTSSAGGWSCRNDTATEEIERAAVQEIIDSNTVIVMPAGNGENGTHCRPDESDTVDTPWFPLHPTYDSSIIIVSSIGEDNKHYNTVGTHSHYLEVDICAPGYNTMGATGTEDDTCSSGCDWTCCVTDDWPYYGSSNGTSFSTPIVAGAVALIKSIKPCLTPSEIEDIIKRTAESIADSSDYPGLLGAGRLNINKALQEAGMYYVQNDTLNGTQTLTAGYRIKAGYNVTDTRSYGSVLIQDGANVTFKTREGLEVKNDFEIESGAEFTAKIDTTAISPCN